MAAINMIPDINVLLMNLMTIRLNDELGCYELGCYQQLLMTVKARARLDEIIAGQMIKDQQHGQGIDQTPGRVSPSSPETEEHRGDDPPPAV